MFAPRSLSCLRVALALIALSAVSSSALAQERIELFTYVSGQYRVVEVDASVSGFGTVRHVTPIPASLAPVWLPLDPTAPLPVFAVAGGQYLVWNNSHRLSRGAAGRLHLHAANDVFGSGQPPAAPLR
jgi:hypothetical protein